MKQIKIVSNDTTGTMEQISENSAKKSSESYYYSEIEVLELPPEFFVGLYQSIKDSVSVATKLSVQSFITQEKDKFHSVTEMLTKGFNDVLSDATLSCVKKSTEEVGHNIFGFSKQTNNFENVKDALSKGFAEVLSDATRSCVANSIPI
ncbi:hypothetical protein TVAG_419540 [Trichomonas vaginalis G3]|uniref:Uncharacterized protein n=1 Tax=Trichomonas vaginalis (strain ATCC PRA-98 / G3) TaxID=412133 RepID=A2EIS8_TRIV3|nr:hypothetical protein TVAGG3_0913770 [Trichomonas vaginalis G3]EAY07412.1 hypothetical protein TVAG_419540 [Trichomonas vaginalis G3]KAI5484622.1 hypothetical protein TVAGG3_0913770 [Trichomonas vaginalis G3]|eukprot:XP_001319635.1 hypothetical protein [Trichomonas vaginalis G3]